MAVRIPDLTETVRGFLTSRLMLDPWLAGLASEHFTFNSQDLIHRAAGGLASEHWREPLVSATLHDLPATRGLGRRAALEVLTSTAISIGHEQFGRAYVDLGVADRALRRLEGFIERQGFGRLVWAYLAVALLENLLALAHYGAIPEDEFTSGLRHRPWVQLPLDGELVQGMAWGCYRIAVRQDRRWVEMTPAGRSLYVELRRFLGAAGYLAERLRLIQLSQFNLLEDADPLFQAVAPAMASEREAFTSFTGLQRGMRVLELGCGPATQTFEGGLWEAVGPTGHLVGLDPAVGMLRRAERKARLHRAQNVEFVQGRGEELPFPDATFDAVVGFQFLEFTDAARTLAEMARVVRPGGVVAVGGACQPSIDAPWLRDWFAPIFDLAERQKMAVRAPFHDAGKVPGLFPRARCRRLEVVCRDLRGQLSEPETSVQLLVQGIGFFQEVLELLPWQARQELVEHLKERGRAVCARTAPEERIVAFPVEFVRAVA